MTYRPRTSNEWLRSTLRALACLWCVGLVVLLTLGVVPAQAVVDEQAVPSQAPPTFESLLSNPDRPEVVGDQLLVAFRKGMNALTAQQLVGRYGATVQSVLTQASKYSGQRIAVIKTRGLSVADLFDQLQNNPAIAAVSLNYKVAVAVTVPDDPRFDDQWGLNNTGQTGGTADADIDAPEAWDVSTGSAGVVVADIDTGIDYTHEDLVANIWTNPYEIPGDGIDNDGNGYVDDVYGIDTANGDSDPWDDHGHGTHTAGTIAAVGDNGVGVTGVGWSTKVMAVKFLDQWGYGSDAGAVEAIYYVIGQKFDNDVNVVAINASWGGGGYDPVLEQAIADAGDAGIIFVAAAGNDSQNTDVVPNYPSCYEVPTIVSVGATDDEDLPSLFSNYGASSVDLFAPGENILSTLPNLSYVPAAGDYFFDDMESGAGKWAAPEGTWSITTEKPKGGAHSWSDSPAADYADDTESSITTEAIDLTTGPVHPMFGFGAYYDLGAGADTLLVEFSGDDGTTWEPVTGLYGSSGGSWEAISVPVPSYLRTDQFRARFHLITDSEDGAVADGVYIDDVGIGASPPSHEYAEWSGTSMATPHVTGSIAVLAAEYPDDGPLERISRIRSGVDVLPQLAGQANTGGRLNFAGSIDPGLVRSPWATGLFYERPVAAGSELTVEGVLFGDAVGRVLLSDGVTEVEAPVVWWAAGVVEATMPDTRNGMVILERADGLRCLAGTVSAWADGDSSILRRNGNTALSVDGTILSFGGYTQGGWEATSTIESYDPSVDAWSSTSKLRLPEPRVYAASAVAGERVYVIGGFEDDTGHAHDNMWAYDFGTNEWQTMAPLPVPLMFHEAVALDGSIWVFGGSDDLGEMNHDLYVYDPEVDSWSVLNGPSTPRIAGAGIALDGLIYYFGGLSTDTDDYLTTAEVYDPYADSWSALPDLPSPLARMGVAEYGSMVYLVGGTRSDWWQGGTKTMLRFDPAANTWKDLSSTVLALPADAAVHSSPAVALEGQGIYSMNGMSWGSSSARMQLLADPELSISITSVDPTHGPPAGGNTVTILGTNFYDVTGVNFGSIPATGFTVASPGRIVATAPAGAVGVVQVQVVSTGGSTADTEADDYAYGDAPSITGLSVHSGSATGGTTVVITGTGFNGVTGYDAVTFGGIPAASFTRDSETRITAVSPAHAAGPVQVQVRAAVGATPDGAADDFLYFIAYSVLRGVDRYDTAIKIARAMFPGALPAGSGLVLAPGDSFQEALCGAPLASAYGGPVLLTPRTVLTAAVKAEILRLRPQTVICIGLSETMKNKVQTALGATGTAIAIRGANVYDMSYRVAKALGAKVGDLGGATAIVARGDVFADAIGVSPLACAQTWPVILTGRGTVLSASAVRAFNELGIHSAIKVGTYAVLPAGVNGLANLSGANRYATNVNVAKWALANAGLSFGHLGIATGDKFPDALAAGPYLAQQRGVVLLSPLYGPLPGAAAGEITSHADDVQHVSFMGMIEPVIGQVKALLP
jgi:subtilisin family serine protease/N-acetylneuraminic acid mutarotase